MKIELDGGKYTYVFDNGNQYALRNGGQWRDLTGDNLIYWMACKIVELEDELKNIKQSSDLKEKLQSLAEDLAIKEVGYPAGLKCSEVGDYGVKVYVYHDNWDYSAGETWCQYSWKELKSIYDNTKEIKND